jgi:hypothetical protein
MLCPPSNPTAAAAPGAQLSRSTGTSGSAVRTTGSTGDNSSCRERCGYKRRLCCSRTAEQQPNHQAQQWVHHAKRTHTAQCQHQTGNRLAARSSKAEATPHPLHCLHPGHHVICRSAGMTPGQKQYHPLNAAPKYRVNTFTLLDAAEV